MDETVKEIVKIGHSPITIFKNAVILAGHMLLNDKVLQLMRIKGPIIPASISKEINQNLMMTSAILGELSSKKEVKVSHVKIGGSPLYYLEGQEARLQEYANRLGPYERIAYNVIREKKVLRDKELDAKTRVALRLIKDFAIPLQVTYGDQDEIFWKWYLTPNQEAEETIKVMLESIKPIPPEPKQVPAPKVPEPTLLKRQMPAEIEKPPIKPIEAPQPKLERKPILEQVQKVERAKPAPIAPVREVQETMPKQQPVVEPSLDDLPQTPFLKSVKNFFAQQRIAVKKVMVVKKSTEVDFIIALPSPFGELEFYCKARAKKKLNETDLANVFVQGQLKKLPAILISDGELTKKSQDMLRTELKGLYYKRL